MKKILFLLIISTVIVNINTAAKPLFEDWGFKMGFVVSNVESELFSEAKDKLGYDLGIFGTRKIKDAGKYQMYLQTEVHYTQKGIRDLFVVFNPVTLEIIDMAEYKHRLDYLSVPILLKLERKYKTYDVFFMAGPRFDYLFNYRSEVYDELFDEVNNFVIGADFGFGTSIQIHQNLKGSIEFKYNLDITESEDQFHSKNKALQILFSFQK